MIAEQNRPDNDVTLAFSPVPQPLILLKKILRKYILLKLEGPSAHKTNSDLQTDHNKQITITIGFNKQIRRNLLPKAITSQPILNNSKAN